MTRKIVHLLAMTIASALLASCSGSGPAPTSPQGPAPESITPPAAEPAASEGALFAAFDLALDVTSDTMDLTPVRLSQAIGDEYSEVGLTPAFTGLFGNTFRATALRRTGPTTIEVDFEAIHPFTAAQRPDLAIFNFKLWIGVGGASQTVNGIESVPGVVDGADGYGDMWMRTAVATPSAGLAPVQPYVIINEDASAGTFDWQNPSGYNVFFPGQTGTATVEFDLSVSQTMRLFLTADYGQSAVRATRQNPDYRLPQYAGNAPWKVAVSELSNGLAGGDSGSSAEYAIEVWDWKHGQGLNSDVTATTVTVPGVSGPAPLGVPLSGTGTDPTPLTGTIIVQNTESAAEGRYWGLVTVTDNATGIALDDTLTGAIDMSSYVTHQWFPVDILGSPPNAVLGSCGGDFTQSVGIVETYDGSDSTPGGAPIQDYEWDLDYDGTTFTIDTTGPTMQASSATPTTMDIALRVRDTLGQTNIAPGTITISGTPVYGPYARMTNNSEWETPSWDQMPYRNMVSQDDGTVHLLYWRGSTLEYQWQDPCSLAWSGPLSVAGVGGGSMPIQMTRTPDDTVHAAIMYSSHYRHISTAAPNAWTSPVQITTTTGGWNSPSLGSAPNGDLTFCLVKDPSQPCAADNGGIPANPSPVYVIKRTGTTWGSEQTIGSMDRVISITATCGWSSRNQTTAVTATPGGEWIAVWTTLKTAHSGTGPVPGTSKIAWNRTVGGTWQSTADLYNVGVDDVLRVFLDRSPNGRIWLFVGREFALNNTGMATYTSGTWDATLGTVMTQGNGSSAHSVAFDASGRGMLVTNTTGVNTPVLYKVFDEDDSVASIAALPQLEAVAALPGNWMTNPSRHRSPITAALEDGRFTLVYSTERYNDSSPYGFSFNEMELEHATYQ